MPTVKMKLKYCWKLISVTRYMIFLTRAIRNILGSLSSRSALSPLPPFASASLPSCSMYLCNQDAWSMCENDIRL